MSALIQHLKSVLGHSEDEALTVNDIANETGMPHDRTGETIRRSLKEMIESPYYVPIVSSPKGYWIATSVEDVEKAIMGLKSRQAGLQERIDILTEAWLIRSDVVPFDNEESSEDFGDHFGWSGGKIPICS